MRRGEILKLQKRHIVWTEGVIRVVGENLKKVPEQRRFLGTTLSSSARRKENTTVTPTLQNRPELIAEISRKSLKTVVPEVGVEPTRGVNLTGF